jgi:hypothetical protein
VDPTEIARVVLKPHHAPTGKTRHFHGVDRVPVPPPALLRIVKYEGDEGFYLLYCDSDGAWLTDTVHDSIERAQEQARFEFNVDAIEWERA